MVFKIYIAALFLLFSVPNVFCQHFNISPKAQIGGMPGNVYNDIWGYTDNSGKEYAIIGSSKAINIYEVTNCADPVLKFSYQDGSTVTWRDFKTYRNYAYGVCDGACTEGLEVINLDNYTFTQNTSVFTKAHNIYIDTAYARLYVVGSNASSGQLTIYTLDTEVVNGVTYAGTPANPVLLKKHMTTYIHDIFVRDNIAYASHGYDGYKIWDVSNPSNITLLANYDDSSGYNHSSWLTDDGTIAYAAEEVPRGRPLKLFSITGSGLSTAINLTSTFTEPLEKPSFLNNRPHNPFVKGDTLIISYYEDGIQFYDISNPLSPKRIAYYDTYTLQNGLGYNIAAHDWKGPWGVYPFLPSGCMVASDITQGLFTFKIDMPVSDGSNPGVVAKFESSDLVFENNTEGVILRSEKGYCYRLKVSPSGTLTTEEVVCHIYNDPVNKLYKGDLAFPTPENGVILKDTNGNYKITKILDNGTLYLEDVAGTPATDRVNVQNSDVIVETFTKGVILKSGKGACFRIRVNDAGSLLVQSLTSCP